MTTMTQVEVPKMADGRIQIILAGQALQSLRDSGHSLPTALGEVLDNSIEAKANRIDVVLEQSQVRGKKRVHRVLIADDGLGMDVETLHRYLVIGFSTRYMRNDTIGKYGVGAKLAALNMGRRIDVWSRDDGKRQWQHVYFDLDAALDQEHQGKTVAIEPPDEAPLAEGMASIAPSGSGTIVMWSSVERLEEGRMAATFDDLRHDVEKELSRMFRYFIGGGIKIALNGKLLVAHDPLMQMEGSWVDTVLTCEATGEKRSRAAQVLNHFPAKVIANEAIPVGDSTARLVVTLYPKEVIRKRGLGGDALAKELRVPENEGSISFVRLNREVEYTNVPRIFPRGVENADRFIGIEVSFPPALDDSFGIRNVKRGVEPHGDLRKKLRERLATHVTTARKELEEVWGKAARAEKEQEGEHAHILEAAKEVDLTMPKSRVEGPTEPGEFQRAFEDLAKDIGYETPEAKSAYIEKVRDLPFIIESVDFAGNMFIATLHLPGQTIVRLNTRHPFYRRMWEPLKEIADRDPNLVSGAEAVQAAGRTIEALTLLILSYAKAESMNRNPSEAYSELVQYWGQFLSTHLRNVRNV